MLRSLPMSARHLLIGLDGAGLDLVRALGPSALPNLHASMKRGACAPLRSVIPPATLPNWASLLTGMNPGRHGVFDFTIREGYRVHFTAGSVRALPTWIKQLDANGLRCASLFFPGTFPPEPLERGVYISGWDAPVAFEADASFVWPRALHREIVARFGPSRFDDVNEFEADSPGWHAQLPAALCKRIERRVELACWLMEQSPFDVFAIYFGESDTAAHHLWSLHDPSSPRRPAHVSASEQDGLARVYRSLDRAVGALLAAAGGEDVELTIVSDHGSGGASDRVMYLNRALSEAGLLTFHSGTWTRALITRAKDIALTRLPPRLRERLFRSAGALLPGLLESRVRFGAIDMQRTAVFSDELNYFPALHYNLAGRDPLGTVATSELPSLRRRIEDALYALRDPHTGQATVRRVYAREELFHGPMVPRAPDLLLELALSDGYSYNLMPSSSAPPATGPFRRLEKSEYLGRKGRSLAGSHRDRGLYIAAGPRIRAAGEIDANITDVAATLLARLDIDMSTLLASMDGRALDHILIPSPSPSPTASPHLESPSPTIAITPSQRARVEERLRKLGYIE
ncbi:MAG TPA: alkaline phosphatase family protein [Polyangiales bacterium]|nr:alkaline phosphatase family protein [Polyangiales bacterium]